MNFMEALLESKLNPLVAMGKRGSTKVGGFVNKFNADAELLDDLVSPPDPLKSHSSWYRFIDSRLRNRMIIGRRRATRRREMSLL